MKNERLWARPRHVMLGLSLSIMTGVIAALPAGAQTDSPYVWREMHPNSFDASVSTARDQCLRVFLSTAECDEFARKLEAGEYEDVMVPDRVRYGGMNYSRDGNPYVMGSTVKRLGGDTPARRVRLSSGRVLDWYTGFSGAGNNVGVDPRDPPVPVTPPSQTCRWVSFSDSVGIGTHQHTDGTWHPNCCCGQHPHFTPGATISIPNTIQSGGRYRVCE